MPKRPQRFAPRQQRTEAQVDRDRGSAQVRGYTAAWRRASKAHLAKHPLCEYCELEGLTVAASLTDHLYPHRAYAGVFWIEAWWVSSCGSCHSGFKQAVENAGRSALDALARRLGRPVMTARG